PMLVVCTARPELLERRPSWGGGKRNVVTLPVDVLTEHETVELIESLLGRHRIKDGTRKRLLQSAAGNPLFAPRVGRTLRERGEGEELGMPATVQGIVEARLDGLSDDERRVLGDAAVFGKVFWAGAVEGLGGGVSPQDALRSLEHKELIQRARSSAIEGQDEYAFQHFLVADAACDRIPPRERAEKHRLAAEWFESFDRPDDDAELIAHHYVAALELGGNPAALGTRGRLALRHAGDRALRLGACPPAVSYFEAALKLWPEDDPDRPLLPVGLGQAMQGAGDPRATETLEDAQQALSRVGHAEEAAEADALLSEAWWFQGQRDRAFAHLNRARQLVRRAPPSASKARVNAQYAR